MKLDRRRHETTLFEKPGTAQVGVPAQDSNRVKCCIYTKGDYCENFIKFTVPEISGWIPIRLENRFFQN